MGDRRDREHLVATAGQLLGDELGKLLGLGHIHLVQRDQPWPVEQITEGGGVLAELGFDGFQIADRIAARLQGGAVQHVQQHRAAFDVPEEVQP